MSILGSYRDTLASLALEHALGRLRDAQSARLLAGQPWQRAELQRAEKEVALALAWHYYSDAMALALGLAQAPGERDALHDYAQRGTAVCDAATLWVHRVICRLPVVGDPEHAPP